MVADVRLVEGPAMIKSENGMLRAYVQLEVRDRDMLGFVEEARADCGPKGQAAAGHEPRLERRVREPRCAPARRCSSYSPSCSW